MERVFGKDRGSMGRFFRMLQKARLPYLWILAYIAITALLSNVGISVTEYTAELFAGNVNFGTECEFWYRDSSVFGFYITIPADRFGQ